MKIKILFLEEIKNTIENKFKLFIIFYNISDNSKPVYSLLNFGDTREELEDLCRDKGYYLDGKFPHYVIESPLETIQRENLLNEKSLLPDYLNYKIYFEPPAFMKAALNVEEMYKFKILFDENYKFIGKTEIECDLTDNLLFNYMNAWLNGISDPRTGVTTYLGLIMEDRMNFNFDNHYPKTLLNSKVYYLIVTKMEIKHEQRKAYLTLSEKRDYLK